MVKVPKLFSIFNFFSWEERDSFGPDHNNRSEHLKSSSCTPLLVSVLVCLYLYWFQTYFRVISHLSYLIIFIAHPNQNEDNSVLTKLACIHCLPPIRTKSFTPVISSTLIPSTFWTFFLAQSILQSQHWYFFYTITPWQNNVFPQHLLLIFK